MESNGGALQGNRKDRCAYVQAVCIGERVQGATTVNDYMAEVRPSNTGTVKKPCVDVQLRAMHPGQWHQLTASAYASRALRRHTMEFQSFARAVTSKIEAAR